MNNKLIGTENNIVVYEEVWLNVNAIAIWYKDQLLFNI